MKRKVSGIVIIVFGTLVGLFNNFGIGLFVVVVGIAILRPRGGEEKGRKVNRRETCGGSGRRTGGCARADLRPVAFPTDPFKFGEATR